MLPNQNVYLFMFVQNYGWSVIYSLLFRLGETCSHVAAMLYKIETAVRTGMTNVTPTDLPCQWNQNFTKSVTPAPISKIQFYSEEAKRNI